MKFPFKVACVLLSLTLLLNGAGFAVLLGCDQECCQSSPRPVSTQSNSMSCHEAEEMGHASDATLQIQNQPVEAPPVNFVPCHREIASGSLLTAKADFRYDLAVAFSLEQAFFQPKDTPGESA